MAARALFIAGCLLGLVYITEAYDFYVRGREGWVRRPAENYNNWAGRMRFQVNDKIIFNYKKGDDSVLVVKKEDYDSCNTRSPIRKFEDGSSVFIFDRSGAFYFISGEPSHCAEGQRLIVVVLAVRIKPPSSPATPPPSSSPPAPSPVPGLHPPAINPPASSPSSHGPAINPPDYSPSRAPAINPPVTSPSSSLAPAINPPVTSPSSSLAPAISPSTSSPSPVAKPPTAFTPANSPSPSAAPPVSSPAQGPTVKPPATPSPISPVAAPVLSPESAPGSGGGGGAPQILAPSSARILQLSRHSFGIFTLLISFVVLI